MVGGVGSGEPPFTARYVGDGGEEFLNLSYNDAFYFVDVGYI